MASQDIWGYRDDTWGDTDLVGYKVEALDGSIGKIDEASNEVGASYIVVDTGPWIFGKKVMLPAGVVQRIDPENETVVVNRSKDEIKNAPEYDENRGHRDSDYRGRLGDYYGRSGTSRR